MLSVKEYTLQEDRGHIVSFSEYGNLGGPVILNFHGGPGSGSKPHHAERFDLAKYRVILFDQRGCGKSTPLGEIKENATEDLLLDAERIREKLGIEEWFVGGSSWGSTLALLYALKYPKRVRGLLLSAIFLADRDTMVWAMEDPKGVARLMPDVWARRMDFFEKFNINLKTQNEDVLKAFENASPAQQKEIAAGVRNWESNLFSTQADISYKKAEEMTDSDVASTKIFVYYEKNYEFVPDNYILENVETISHIPAVIVHGRFDVLCPIEKAYALKEKMRGCDFVVAPSSGHLLTAEGEVIRRMAHDRLVERHT